MTPTLEDLRDHLDNMYDQLDSEQIDSWPVQGLEIHCNGRTYVLEVKEIQ